jgi:3-isopropylmalate/(R)-2-methylmalate dehydratase small subunit
MRWGIRAIVAESFAEIFFGNCTALGIPCVTAPRSELEALAASVAGDPQLELTVDLERNELRAAGSAVPLSMPASARDALVSGQWDFLGQLLDQTSAIHETAARLPYLSASA